MEAALVLARLGQYLGVSGLFGGALFLARQPADPAGGGERALLISSGAALIACTPAVLVTQVAAMAGPGAPVFNPSMIGQVLTGTAFGYAVVVRVVATVSALLVLLLSVRHHRLWSVAALGGIATLSLAWGGHGAADEGTVGVVHLVADLIHLLSAALWIGALGAILVMAVDRRAGPDPGSTLQLHAALQGFSGAGTLAVTLLILTGLINSWFLIGLTHLPALITTFYGRLLVAKLALFGLMTALAAANRWCFTPRLGMAEGGQVQRSALLALRHSVVVETSIAVIVLAAVAWLGTLAPPTAG